MSESTRYLSCAETARLVRKALKDAFPSTKFGVRSSNYAGGASIRVCWADGPTTARVQEVTSQFAGGGFDGSIDMKFNKDHWLLPDGSTVVAYSPGTSGSMGYYEPIKTAKPHDDAELVSFSSDYVFTDRVITLEFAERLVAQIAAWVGGGTAVPEVVPGKYGWQLWSFADEKVGDQSVFGADKPWDGPHWTWACCVRRASEDATEFTWEKETA